jgi:carboxyl-terminal processing protease
VALSAFLASRDNKLLKQRVLVVRKLFFLLLVSAWAAAAQGDKNVSKAVIGAPQNPPKPRTPPPINDHSAAELEKLLRQFTQVFSAVQSESADPLPVDKALYGGAIPSMLRQLDPHTQFFDPGQFDQLKQMESSEQKGFGSIVSILPGQVIFLQTFPGTPSSKAGIQPGDELVAIGNIAIRSLEPEQIIQLLTEARQQKITAFVRREGSARLLQFSLTPELVDSPSVDRAFLLQPGYGYIRIASWDLQTAKQFREGVEKLGGASLRGLVVDLRNNPGGVVTAALDVASMVLQPGQRILTAKGRTSEMQTADVPPTASPYKFKLAVLINGKTASASEILSGALQDHDRAVIVGQTSYGKGLVQSVLPLSGGAGLAITTAFYYTPSGRSIQHPLQNSALSTTFSDRPSENRPVYKTDNGRTVTGGGGIQPDVRISDAPLTRLEMVLDGSGVITSFATQYLSKHPPLPEQFTISPEMIDEFKVYLSERQIQPGVAEWSQERSWISNRLKEELVTQAQGVAKGDEIHAKIDPQIQAALQAMQDGTVIARRAP